MQQPSEDVCVGCGALIDPECCGCGSPREGHGYDGHGFIPIGCNCCRYGDDADEQRRIARMFREKVAAWQTEWIVKRMRKRADEIEARARQINPNRPANCVPHGAADLRALADELEPVP